MRVVGVGTLGYPEVRNIAALPFTHYRVRKFQNLNKVPAWLHHRIGGRISDVHWNSFRDLDLSPCDLYHFFNGISFGRKPWLTTFETMLPRWGKVPDKKVRQGLELLAGAPCVKLIALSERTAQLQRAHVERTAPDLAEAILAKLTVLHPAQAPGITDLSGKPPITDHVVFTFVGSNFFPKGGRQILQAFEALHQRGMRNWRLNIVSSVRIDPLARATDADVAWAMALIAKYPEHIIFHDRLGNKEVLALFRGTHVSLLPTWAETYGYAVLEAQAYGAPVITTALRALPEINGPRTGWMIDVPLNHMGNAVLVTEEDRTRFAERVREQLTEHLGSILGDPSTIAPRAEAALERIRLHHAPATRAAALERFYDAALQR